MRGRRSSRARCRRPGFFSKLQLSIADKSVVLCSHRSDAQVVERVPRKKGVTLRAALMTAYPG
eukprot:3172085-Pyramimonas_sp.AAC.1